MILRFEPRRAAIPIWALLEGPTGQTSLAKLLFDTGAAKTVVNNKVLEAIGCDPASKASVPLVTASGVVRAPVMEVTRFEVAGFSHESFEVLAHALPPEAPVDGLLGMDFIGKHHIVIDSVKGELHIT